MYDAVWRRVVVHYAARRRITPYCGTTPYCAVLPTQYYAVRRRFTLYHAVSRHTIVWTSVRMSLHQYTWVLSSAFHAVTHIGSYQLALIRISAYQYTSADVNWHQCTSLILRRVVSYYGVIRCITMLCDVLRNMFDQDVLRCLTLICDIIRRATTYGDILRRTMFLWWELFAVCRGTVHRSASWSVVVLGETLQYASS